MTIFLPGVGGCGWVWVSGLFWVDLGECGRVWMSAQFITTYLFASEIDYL